MEALDSQVKHAAALMAEQPDLDDTDVINLLVEHGFSQLLATRLNAFVPHAFGRVLLLSKHQPGFASTFLLEDDHGRRVQVPFSREPIMDHASNLARAWMSTNKNHALLVADRSSEVHAARQVCDWDGDPAPIEFCEPVIVGIDVCEYGLHIKPRPWWRLW